MLDCASTYPHNFWSHPLLHSVRRFLIQVTSQATSRGLVQRDFREQVATVERRSFIQSVTIFVIGAHAQQPLVVRADVGIFIRFEVKVLASEQSGYVFRKIERLP